MDPTEHFGIYFGYIRRLFQSWVSPFKGMSHLSLLGVTFDHLIHFGQHCAKVRRKVKPRLAHLRAMTGRSWDLREAQLRTVANGYVRGALEYAAPAWLPATSSSHVEQLDREMRAAARVITGCPRSTPVVPLMAEAGLVPVRVAYSRTLLHEWYQHLAGPLIG